MYFMAYKMLYLGRRTRILERNFLEKNRKSMESHYFLLISLGHFLRYFSSCS